MASLAVSNLLHDKVRFAVTVAGVVFAVVLAYAWIPFSRIGERLTSTL
jgi:hypothetical protein